MSPNGRTGQEPVDRIIEVALFAPLGLLAAVREELPGWVQKGRQQLAAQVPLARAVGELAVRHGSKQARQSLDRLRRQADDLLSDMGGGRAPADGPDPHEADFEQEEEVVGPDEDWARPTPGGVDSPEAGELPIPGYDTLSASQVVQRLPGLSMEELEAVRSYELAGRARKTVLLRVAQLRAAS